VPTYGLLGKYFPDTSKGIGFIKQQGGKEGGGI
jgi:hypothetical protein